MNQKNFHELRAARFAEQGNLCSFGLTEALAVGITGISGGLLSGGLATGLAGALEGAGAGAGLAGITGGNPLTGALTGGISGGAIGGLGPVLGDAISPVVGEAAGPAVGDVLAGAGGGLVGSAVTGQSPLTGALTGGAGGLAAGLSASPAAPASTGVSTPASGISGGGSSAAAAALPTDVTAGTPIDLTSIGGGLGSGSTPIDLTSIGGGLGPGSTTPIGGNGSFFQGGIGGTAPIGAGTGTGSVAGLPPSQSAFAPTGTPPQFTEANLFNPDNPNALAVPGGPTGGTGGGGLFGNLFGGGGSGSGSGISSLLSNPGVLLGAGVLGSEFLNSNKQLPEQAQLEKLAAQTQGQGNQLSAYINSGTLPPGAQEAVNSASQAAKASVRANFAQLGLAGSTMEAEALQNVDKSTAAQSFQMADQLLKDGANFTTLSSDLYQKLLQDTLSQDQAFSGNLARFAAALAGARTP